LYKIEVEEVIDIPLKNAFDMLTDHANYKLYPGIKGAQLLKSGKEDKNGVGAIREVKLSSATVQEEIVAFKRNTLLQYRIISAKPVPIHHVLGKMDFSPVGPGKTKVKWVSEFAIQVPFIGQMLDNYHGPKMAQSFSDILHGVASRYQFFK